MSGSSFWISLCPLTTSLGLITSPDGGPISSANRKPSFLLPSSCFGPDDWIFPPKNKEKDVYFMSIASLSNIYFHIVVLWLGVQCSARCWRKPSSCSELTTTLWRSKRKTQGDANTLGFADPRVRSQRTEPVLEDTITCWGVKKGKVSLSAHPLILT